jgi:hypothetical protein
MPTQLETATVTTTITEEETETDEPIMSHVVPGTKDKTSEAVVMEARVFGIPVTALCGYTWVPQRDPMKHDVCQKCLEILKMDCQFPKS